jgi:4-oxalocrotonate tautomerase
MPHITVKLFPGRSEEQKKDLSERIVKDVMSALGSSEASISVAFEEVKSEEWTKKVYEPEIAPNMDRLYKKPGYKPG